MKLPRNNARILWRLPLLLGTALLLVPWMHLMWNATFGELVPSLRFRTKHSIAGLVVEAGHPLGWRDFLTGRYQKSLSETIGLNSPLYKWAIRWKAQTYYTLLDTSPFNNVVIGRRRELYEPTYTREYCQRNVASMLQKAEPWAARIRQIQDFYEARQKLFLYVISPSKAAAVPDALPRGYSCPAPEADRRGKVSAYRAVLQRHGVHYIDAASLVDNAGQSYSAPMFPRGGTHWNRLGATLAASALTEAVNRASGQTYLTPFSFSWQISYDSRESDRDLLDLLNLPIPDDHYPVPRVTTRSEPHLPCQPAHITAVASSFLFELAAALEQVACPPELHLWFYWDQKLFVYERNRRDQLPIDTSERRRDLLDWLDVLILEENEAAFPESSQVRKLYDFIGAETAAEASNRAAAPGERRSEETPARMDP